MPTGHTDKQTMTTFRAGLILGLPLAERQMSHAQRRQVGEMQSYGWVVKDAMGYWRHTGGGLAMAEKFFQFTSSSAGAESSG